MKMKNQLIMDILLGRLRASPVQAVKAKMNKGGCEE
jgi:hypothetical protein